MTSNFADAYTKANLAADAAVFEPELFQALTAQIENAGPSEKKWFALGLISAILCALGRGDVVVDLVRNATETQSADSFKEALTIVREAITIATPFVGLPNTMPAIFGLVAEIRASGVEITETTPRIPLSEKDYHTVGIDTSKLIYRGVGNSDVAPMVGKYFPETSYYAHTTIFGYLIAGSRLLSLQEAELVVASSIIGLGAVRQARSHCKGSIQLGNSVDVMEAIVQTAYELAKWNKTPLLGSLDVPALAAEVRANLANE
ncbi:uncharacterized protein N7487_004302 [Penicillium crustosum]|uniref:uncharacterized protein n=1 Tax=Penicillium crustosum TaxID=36656 RepID=UPI00239C00B5|nr:uncharacterized protein N7487_004302 [Penicillium crustosum]KAJ5409943.1 hypothetical protein N7487_004302 [Penicillium crustosum]